MLFQFIRRKKENAFEWWMCHQCLPPYRAFTIMFEIKTKRKRKLFRMVVLSTLLLLFRIFRKILSCCVSRIVRVKQKGRDEEKSLFDVNYNQELLCNWVFIQSLIQFSGTMTIQWKRESIPNNALSYVIWETRSWSRRMEDFSSASASKYDNFDNY